MSRDGADLTIAVDQFDRDDLGSVVMSLDGNVFPAQNTAPFALGGYDAVDGFKTVPELMQPGTYQVVVQLFSGANGSGSLLRTIRFRLEVRA